MWAIKKYSILLASCLASASVQSVLLPPPVVARLSLVFEPNQTLLSPHQKSLINSHFDKLGKCGGWQFRSDAGILYRVSSASLPRLDYQLIGERVKDIEAYLRIRYEHPKVHSFILVGEDIGNPFARVNEFRDGTPDYHLEVVVRCEQ